MWIIEEAEKLPDGRVRLVLVQRREVILPANEATMQRGRRRHVRPKADILAAVKRRLTRYAGAPRLTRTAGNQ